MRKKIFFLVICLLVSFVGAALSVGADDISSDFAPPDLR